LLVGIKVKGDVEVFAAEIVERKEQANQVAINQFLELNTIDGQEGGDTRHCTAICEQH